MVIYNMDDLSVIIKFRLKIIFKGIIPHEFTKLKFGEVWLQTLK